MVVELRAASVARPAVLGPLLDVREADAAVEVEGLTIVCSGIVEFKGMRLVEALLDNEWICWD